MGYDISYHPISVEQMNEWYFSRLKEIAKGDTSKAEAIAKEAGMDPFYIERYIDVLRHGAEVGEDEEFASTHVYFLAVVQGFFAKYHYTRGTGISFLVDEHQWFFEYTDAFGDLFPDFTPEDYFEDTIIQNYCGGLYIGAKGVVKLLEDYAHDAKVKNAIDTFFDSNAPVFIQALQEAKSKNLGLLEATEVIVPNPFDLNQSDCYSNLFNCDPAGAYIYQDVATKQVGEAMKQFENKDK